uniref:Uncharacterized protein n=1 Tax=Cynoglossus semilaevis TaxID=244447 RepID=A0A3P8WGR4_CYNSE
PESLRQTVWRGPINRPQCAALKLFIRDRHTAPGACVSCCSVPLGLRICQNFSGSCYNKLNYKLKHTKYLFFNYSLIEIEILFLTMIN